MKGLLFDVQEVEKARTEVDLLIDVPIRIFVYLSFVMWYGDGDER